MDHIRALAMRSLAPNLVSERCSGNHTWTFRAFQIQTLTLGLSLDFIFWIWLPFFCTLIHLYNWLFPIRSVYWQLFHRLKESDRHRWFKTSPFQSTSWILRAGLGCTELGRCQNRNMGDYERIVGHARHAEKQNMFLDPLSRVNSH